LIAAHPLQAALAAILILSPKEKQKNIILSIRDAITVFKGDKLHFSQEIICFTEGVKTFFALTKD